MSDNKRLRLVNFVSTTAPVYGTVNLPQSERDLIELERSLQEQQDAKDSSERVFERDIIVKEIARYPGAFNRLARVNKRFNELLTGPTSGAYRKEMIEGQTVKSSFTIEQEDTGDDVDVIRVDHWKFNGELHRQNDLPASVHTDITDPNSQKLLKEVWYEHGKRHRVGRPAFISYKPDGSVLEEAYYEKGKIIRVKEEDGTVLDFDERGRVTHTQHPDGTITDRTRWYR